MSIRLNQNELALFIHVVRRGNPETGQTTSALGQLWSQVNQTFLDKRNGNVLDFRQRIKVYTPSNEGLMALSALPYLCPTCREKIGGMTKDIPHQGKRTVDISGLPYRWSTWMAIELN